MILKDAIGDIVIVTVASGVLRAWFSRAIH